MSAPVTPQNFKDVVSDPTASLCGNFIATLLRLPTLIYEFFAWFLDSDGNITAAALQQIHRPGDLIMSASPTAGDSKRLLCDGSEVSQATYPALYAAIGATWGAAGGGNFKLPDFRGFFPVGVGNFPSGAAVALAGTGGEDKHLLTNADTGIHSHVVGRFNANSGTESDKLWFLKGSLVETGGLTREVSGGSSILQEEDISVPAGDWANVGKQQFTTNPVAFNVLPPFRGVFFFIAT